MSLLQAKGLPHGEDFGREFGAASIVSQMRALPHEFTARGIRVRSGQSEWILLLHAALPVAGEER